MYNKKNEFGSCEEPDMKYEKCKRIEVLAHRAEKEVKKRDKPIIKEKNVFIGWKDKKKKKKKKY